MNFKSLIIGALATIIIIYTLKKVNEKVKVPVVSPTLDELLP